MVNQNNRLTAPLGPKAQARADQAAIEKRRRELLDEKQTMDARKVEQVQNELRRQSYADINKMQFAPQHPIQYNNTVPAVELSQAPIQPGTESAVGGPETPSPRWAMAPQESEQAQPKWMQAPAADQLFNWSGEFDPKAFAGLKVIQSKPLHDGNDAINAGIEEAAALVPGGYANFQKQPPDPARMRAMGYVQDPLAKGGYAKPAQPDAFATIKNNPSDNNLLTDIGRAASAPFQQNENVRSAAGVPIAFGHGLGQGWQALANNAMALGTDATNSVIQTANPNATPLERPRVSLFDRNALLDEGGLLQSDTNAIPQAMGQFASVRGPIGKFSKGGGFGNMAAKDAAAFALSTEHTAPRLSDMISSNTPVLGPIADLLRSNENDPAIVSMMKNLGEDLSISALTAGILGLVDKSLTVVRPGAANSGTDPRLDPAVAAQIKRVLAKEPVDPAMPANALASPKPFSASAVPAAGNIVRRNADRIVTGGIGATIGGASDAFAAPGDGGGDGEGGPPIGAGIGAGIGIFGPRAVASAASRGFRAAARPFRPVGFDERVAARAVRNALKSGGITTPEQAAAAMTARFGEKPASVADLTQDGVGTAAGLSRLPGATGEAARARGEDLLQNRAGRLEGDIAQANPSLNPAAIAGDVDRMVQLAQSQAKPAYDGLRARYPLGSIVSDRLEQLRGLDILAPHLRGVDRYRETLAATEGRVVGDFEYWDLVKRSLDDTEQAAVARNQPVPYDLDSTRQAIVQEMDRLVPDYPAARELGGEAPKMRDAFKQGQALLGGRYTAEDVSRLIQGITGQQLTAAQAGVIRSMVAKTEGARGAMASLMSTGARRKLAQVFGPEAAEAMQARFAADAAIVNNAQRINPNVGSVTSQAQLGGGIGPMVADAIRAVRSPAEAALAALSRSGSYSQAQRDLMGQMLLDGVTPENLERIFRSRTPRGPRPAPGGPAVPPTGGGAGPAGPAGGAPHPRGPRPAPSDEAVLSAMSQVNQLAAGRPAPRGPMGPPVREAMWNGPVPSKPQSLLAWIRSQGGINDTNYMTGDLTAIMGRANGMPGLLNRKSGQGLDDLAAAAYHQGFDVNPDDANSLVRLIEEEFGGNPNYRLGAKEEWDAYQETLRARRRPLPGETSNASPAVTGALLSGGLTGGATYAATGDEDLALRAGGLAAIGGGIAGNRLAKFGGGRKPPKLPVPKAPVAGGPVATKDRAVWEMRGAGLSNAEISRRADTTESMVDVHYRKAERALGAPPSDPSVLSKYPEKAPTQAAATVSTAEPFTSKAGNATLNYEERPFWWADDSLDVSMDYVPKKPPTLSETKDLFTQMYDRMKAKMQAEGRSVYSANGDTPSKRKLYDSAVKALPPPDGYTPMKSPGSDMILFVRNDMVGKLPEGAPKDLAPISSVTPLKPAPKPPARQGFGGSKLPMDEGARMARAQKWAEGYEEFAPELYIGTTHDVDAFDVGKYNIESDWGRAIYATNSKTDVRENYAGFGPDLTNRIQREAELIADDTGRNYNDPDVVSEARAKLSRNEGATMPVVARLKKPLRVGGKDETFLEMEDAYNPVTEEYGEAKGPLVDLMQGLRDASAKYNDVGDIQNTIDELFEVGLDGGATASGALKILRESDALMYATDDVGAMASNEIIREAFQRAGFDGVIDKTVSQRFKSMKGMDANTAHYIIFDPPNIRGKFAKFDPAESSSSKLLAGMGGPSGAGAAGGGILGATLAPDANGDGTVDAQERANGFLGGAFSGGIAGKALGSRAAGKFGNRMKGPPKFRGAEPQGFVGGGIRYGKDPTKTENIFRDNVGKPFNSDREATKRLNRLFDNGNYIDTKLPTHRLYATQENVHGGYAENTSNRYVEGAGGVEAPAVVKYKGNYYVTDGHHRITKAVMDGKSNVRVRLYDVDGDTALDTPLLDFNPERHAKDRAEIKMLLDELFADAKPVDPSTPDRAGFFGSGKAESRPKPPPNRLAVSKQLAASLNKSKVSPPLRERLTANAALPPGERKSIMEATGWDNEILRIAAPFIREGTRMDTEIGAKVAALIKQANANPVEYALRQTMAKGAYEEAQKRFKQASGARSRAATNLENLRTRNMLNPNQPAVKQQLSVHKQRRDDAEQFLSEAARLRDEAKVLLDRADIEMMSLKQVRDYANAEIQRITDALGANRPNTKGTAMLPAYNPMGKPKPGPINPAGAKPNKQAAEELAHMLFEADQAELFAKLQAGDITPQNRKALGMAASYYARHPGMALLTAGGAGVTGAGAVAIYADQKKRSEDVREVARQRQAEPERPGFKWDWQTQSKKRDFVVTLQSALNDLGYEIGIVDGSMIRADGKQTKTQKALEHFLWSLDNTRVPGSPVTEDDWKAIEREALAARRKRA